MKKGMGSIIDYEAKSYLSKESQTKKEDKKMTLLKLL